MLTKKQIVTFTICIVIVIVVLILFFKESFSYSGKGKNEKNEIRENFPASVMNVLYSDANGNLSSTNDLGVQNLTTSGNVQIGENISSSGNIIALRKRIGFSGTNDPNHTIYNNYTNIDEEGKWDGMKMNVYDGLDVRTGNASGVTPKTVFSVRDDLAKVKGKVNIHAGSPYAITENRMENGSLTIGDIAKNYGGGTNYWSSNTAGLLMECKDNTEIAIHDSGHRVASAMYFEGGDTNRISIGRNMGWGTTKVNIPDALTAGSVTAGSVASTGGLTAGSVTSSGDLTASGRNILAELNTLNAFRSDLTPKSTDLGYYYKLPDGTIVQYGIVSCCRDCGYTITFPKPLRTLISSYVSPYSSGPYTFTKNIRKQGFAPVKIIGLSGDSAWGPATKPDVEWMAIGYEFIE